MNESLTVLIQTSPIPSHPSTALIEALFRSFGKADGILESRIVILADGYEECDSETKALNTENIKHGRCYSKTAENYRIHLKRLRQAVQNEIHPFCPRAGGSIELIELETRHGSALAIKTAMERVVSTPLVMICQHDNFFVNNAPLREVVGALREERGLGIGATCIHFLSTATLGYRDKIQRRYKLDLGEPISVKYLKYPLVPLIFWYGRSHVTYSDYVRSYCLNRPIRKGTHLEELLGESQLNDIRSRGLVAHKEYGTYVLDQGVEVLYHVSGRRAISINPSYDRKQTGEGKIGLHNSFQINNGSNYSLKSTQDDQAGLEKQIVSKNLDSAPQVLEGSFTTARFCRAIVPGLSFPCFDEEEAKKGKSQKKTRRAKSLLSKDVFIVEKRVTAKSFVPLERNRLSNQHPQ